MAASSIRYGAFLFALVASVFAVAAAAWARTSHPFRTTLEVAGGTPVSLYAEETGEGPPVLLLHGLGESIFTWRKIVPELAETHRVIALDLKGFGRSDKPLDTAYRAEDQAELVAAFMEKRGLSEVTLIGHSFGGTVAARTALTRAKARIARLVLVSAPALPHSFAPDLDVASLPALPELVTIPLPPKTLARILLKEARGGRGEVSESDVEGYAAPYYELAAKHAFLLTARSILAEEDGDIAARYRTIRQPVLVVTCRKDTIVPLKAGRRLARVIPHARLAVLEGCHHLPQEERPSALLAEIKPFL